MGSAPGVAVGEAGDDCAGGEAGSIVAASGGCGLLKVALAQSLAGVAEALAASPALERRESLWLPAEEVRRSAVSTGGGCGTSSLAGGTGEGSLRPRCDLTGLIWFGFRRCLLTALEHLRRERKIPESDGASAPELNPSGEREDAEAASWSSPSRSGRWQRRRGRGRGRGGVGRRLDFRGC